MLGLCDRFKCLPSQLLKEDAELLRLVRIQAMGNPEHRDEPDPWEGGDTEWPT